MKSLLEKLNYKGQKRIALLNAEDDFAESFMKELGDVRVDKEIDQRYPYEFMIVFVKSISETEQYAPGALHNLLADGILWFCYPKKTSSKYKTDLKRDNVWDALNRSGFYTVRLISVDDDWSAMRFRNARFIRSKRGR
jgi:hypothetical protein